MLQIADLSVCITWILLGLIAYFVLRNYTAFTQIEYLKQNPDMSRAVEVFSVVGGLVSFAVLISVMTWLSIRQEWGVSKRSHNEG